MMEFLNFTFQSFWHFVGVVILITTTGTMLAAIAGALRG